MVVVAVVVVVVVVDVVVVSRQAESLDQAPKAVHPSPWMKSYCSQAMLSPFNLAEFHDSIPDETSSRSCRGVQESSIKLEKDGWYPLSSVAKDYHALYYYLLVLKQQKLPCPLWKISTGRTLEKLGREGRWFHHLART